MRVIKLVADRQRERRGLPDVSGRSVWRAEGRSIDEKGWVPLRYWSAWFFGLGLAVATFYVILTPIWIGLRGRGLARRVQGAPAPLTNASTSACVRSRTTVNRASSAG